MLLMTTRNICFHKQIRKISVLFCWKNMPYLEVCEYCHVFRENGYTMCELTIVGSSFLWHQIRCIVGILFLIGQGKENPEVILCARFCLLPTLYYFTVFLSWWEKNSDSLNLYIFQELDSLDFEIMVIFINLNYWRIYAQTTQHL